MEHRTTYKQIEGKNIDVISPYPTGDGGSLILDNFKNLADLTATRQAFYFSPLIDFTQLGDVHLLTVPTGYVAIVMGLSALVLSRSNVTQSAFWHYGTTADPDAFMSWIGGTGPEGISPPHDSVDYEELERIPDEYFNLTVPDLPSLIPLHEFDEMAVPAGTTLTAGIVDRAYADDYKGKFFIRALLIPTT